MTRTWKFALKWVGVAVLFVMFALLGAAGPPVLAAPGDRDPSFGTGGKVLTNFAGSSLDQAFAVAIQPDGRIVAAGVSDAGGALTSRWRATWPGEGVGTGQRTPRTAPGWRGSRSRAGAR